MPSRSQRFRMFLAAAAAPLVAALVAAALVADDPQAAWWTGLAAGSAAALVSAMLLVRTADAERERPSSSGPARQPAAVADPPPSSGIDISRLQRPGNPPSVRAVGPSPNAVLLETVLGTMIEGVIVIDDEERVLYVNAAARGLLEIPERRWSGRPLLELVRSRHIEAAVRTALHSRQLHRSEFDLPRKEKSLALTTSPFTGAPGAVLVLHDVTELRRLERLRSEFVSNVSHELKTPLTAIQAYADTLADGAIDDPQHNRAFLNRILEQAERLQLLIQDLLRLAKIESQQEVFDIREVDLSAAVAGCVEEHQAVASAKGVALEAACEEHIAILADSDGLRQILNNLVDNALNYTPSGGRVRAVARAEPGWGVIEVADSGVGIAKEDQARIFERFYRVDRARARAVGGTGLGLSIVKHLVQTFGGNIAVASELNRGSTFVVRIPRAASENAQFLKTELP